MQAPCSTSKTAASRTHCPARACSVLQGAGVRKRPSRPCAEDVLRQDPQRCRTSSSRPFVALSHLQNSVPRSRTSHGLVAEVIDTVLNGTSWDAVRLLVPQRVVGRKMTLQIGKAARRSWDRIARMPMQVRRNSIQALSYPS